MIICNAFSLNMIQGRSAEIKVREISISEVQKRLSGKFESAIGHKSTAELLQTLFGIEIPVERKEVKIGDYEELLIIQISQRLEEGKVLSKEELEKLYENGKIKFYEVLVSVFP